eukprot:gnl/MRDRNA2_/MRDRNA2_118907_c0_seq1.p1 gnl/MRDRNA2_/MRDRNA2_118907_c0~~gnl/MRDRNA2_/MRDRNA2_118907_c0_seq1.p1  ORF type:complete len:486 (-),score=125.60 gnl/MRDRNA2_/MRDRNA2_118907_c0_seq1:122-1579(-)
MKLKRFLLRYEPPGVGLECAKKDGEVDVRHKDLPYKESVHSSQEVYTLVDELLKSEPELLTRQKHQRALLQLLGRLYQLDVPLPPAEETAKGKKAKKEKGAEDPVTPGSARPGGDEEEAPKNEQENAEDPPPGTVHAAGIRVVLVNLKNKHASHNGSLATINKVTHGGRKYEVETSEGETFTVKGANHLVPLAADPRNFSVGVQVAICGLRNHAALNGQICRVIEYNDASQRWEVRAIDSGQLFRVKPENIVTIQDDSAPPVNIVNGDPQGAPLSVGAMQPAPEAPVPAANPPMDVKVDTSPVSNGNSPAQAAPQDPAESPNKGAAFGAPPQQKVEAPAPAAASNITDPKITEGCVIVLTGLKNAAWLNGEKADVLAVDLERHRYEIRLQVDNSVKKVRAENCQLFSAAPATTTATPKGDAPAGGVEPFKKGDIVALTGLRSSPGLNGKRAEILRHDAATDRYEIRLEMDSSVKKVRRDNLEAVS